MDINYINELFDIANDLARVSSSALCLEEAYQLQNWDAEAYYGAISAVNLQIQDVLASIENLYEAATGERLRTFCFNAK